MVEVSLPVEPADQVVNVQETLVLGQTVLSPTEVGPTAPEPDEPLDDNDLKGLSELLGIIPLPWLKDEERTIGDQAAGAEKSVPIS